RAEPPDVASGMADASRDAAHQFGGDGHRSDRHRSDLETEFTGASIPNEVFDRVLRAAHAAPNVGLFQPWDFVVTAATKMRPFRDHGHSERQTMQRRAWQPRGVHRPLRVSAYVESKRARLAKQEGEPNPAAFRGVRRPAAI